MERFLRWKGVLFRDRMILYNYYKFYIINNLCAQKTKMILDTTYEIGYHVLFYAEQDKIIIWNPLFKVSIFD